MKNNLKYVLHKLLGFDRYLFLFSLFKIYSLKWDKKENDFFAFMSLIPPDSDVLDIGANIGIMTAHISQKVKDRKVVAFEPVPENIKALKRIIKFFGLKNVEVCETALGDANGEIEMVMPEINSVRMQGLSHVAEKNEQMQKGSTYSVSVKRLDDIDLLNKQGRIGGIKMDVENYEYKVLKGATTLLKKHKPVLYIELWENENRENCFLFLKELGYSIHVLYDRKISLYDPSLHKKQNFLFIPA